MSSNLGWPGWPFPMLPWPGDSAKRAAALHEKVEALGRESHFHCLSSISTVAPIRNPPGQRNRSVEDLNVKLNRTNGYAHQVQDELKSIIYVNKRRKREFTQTWMFGSEGKCNRYWQRLLVIARSLAGGAHLLNDNAGVRTEISCGRKAGFQYE